MLSHVRHQGAGKRNKFTDAGLPSVSEPRRDVPSTPPPHTKSKPALQQPRIVSAFNADVLASLSRLAAKHKRAIHAVAAGLGAQLHLY